MSESNQPELTDEEFEEYKRVLKKVETAVHGESVNHILNALCYVIGAVSADTDIPKRLVISNLVNSVEHSYEIHKAEYDKGEIKWLN